MSGPQKSENVLEDDGRRTLAPSDPTIPRLIRTTTFESTTADQHYDDAQGRHFPHLSRRGTFDRIPVRQPSWPRPRRQPTFEAILTNQDQSQIGGGGICLSPSRVRPHYRTRTRTRTLSRGNKGRAGRSPSKSTNGGNAELSDTEYHGLHYHIGGGDPARARRPTLQVDIREAQPHFHGGLDVLSVPYEEYPPASPYCRSHSRDRSPVYYPGPPPPPPRAPPYGEDLFSFPALEGDGDIVECDFKLLGGEEDSKKRVEDELEKERAQREAVEMLEKREMELRARELKTIRLGAEAEAEAKAKAEAESEAEAEFARRGDVGGGSRPRPQKPFESKGDDSPTQPDHDLDYLNIERDKEEAGLGELGERDNDSDSETEDGSDVANISNIDIKEEPAGLKPVATPSHKLSKSSPGHRPFVTKSGSTLNILSSKPSGNYSADGRRIFELDADIEGASRPLFRWIHIQQKQMNFETFVSEIMALSGLTEVQQYLINAIFIDIREQKIKSVRTSNGTSVGLMIPSFVSQVGFRDTLNGLVGGIAAPDTERSIAIWCAIPYFTHEKYSGLLSASTPLDFPSPTLLQVGHSAAKRARDLQQSICQAQSSASASWSKKIGKRKGNTSNTPNTSNTSKEHCLHVSQTWCLQVDSSMVITCGQMTRDQLQAETLTPNIKSGEDTQTLSGLRVIVQHLGTVQWTFELAKTTTWLDLMVSFHHFWPRRLLFYHRRRIITSRGWTRIVRNATATEDDLVLELQIGKPVGPGDRRLETRPKSKSHAPTNTEMPGARTQTKPRKTWFNQWEKNSRRGTSQQFHVFTWLERVLGHGVLANNPEGKTNETGSNDKGNCGDDGTNQSSNPKSPGYFENDFYKGIGNPLSKPEALDRVLLELHMFLSTKTISWERKEYARVPPTSMAKLISTALTSDASYVSRRPGLIDTRLLTDCIVIFKFYFPPDKLYDSEGLPGVFAGALSRACLQQVTQSFLLSDSTIPRIAAQLSYLQSLLSCAPAQKQATIEVPEQFLKALIHIISGLVSPDSQRSRKHICLALNLVESGIESIAASMSPFSLRQRQTALPDDIIAFFLSSLCRRGVNGTPDLEPIYDMAVEKMARDIGSGSSNRLPRPKLSRLQDELYAINIVLSQQKDIVEKMKNHIWALREQAFIGINSKVLAPYEMAGPRLRRRIQEYMANAFMANCGDDMAMAYKHELLAKLSRELDESADWFSEANHDIEFLREDDAHHMESTRDTRENAIYAFTILSFIFLPLSTVASIFGMNSVDVRDMELGQWAYWVIAVPLTVLSGVMGLWLTGTLKVWIYHARGRLGWWLVDHEGDHHHREGRGYAWGPSRKSRAKGSEVNSSIRSLSSSSRSPSPRSDVQVRSLKRRPTYQSVAAPAGIQRAPTFRTTATERVIRRRQTGLYDTKPGY